MHLHHIMTSFTPDQQLQKLINAAFHLRLSPQKFAKLFSQLQERVHLEANLAGDAFFRTLSPETKSIDALFIQYIVTLAFDFKSPLCVPKLLYYIRVAQRKALKNDPSAVVAYEVLTFCEPLIFVALTKSLHLWPQDPSSVTPETRRSLLILLIGYMADCSNAESHPSHQKTRAIAAFLLALARTKVVLQILPAKNTNHKEFEAFDMAISKFSKLLETMDPVLAHDLRTAYAAIFDAIKHPNAIAKTFDSFKPTRVFKLIWLEALLITNRATQHDVFRAEAQVFLLHENPVKLIPSLITAAFDGLSVALLRNDSAQTIALWKAFITKRLPLIVKDLLASSFININPTLIESMICNPITTLSNDTLTLMQRAAGNSSLVDEMFPSEGAANTQYGLRYDFLRVLVSLSVLTEHAFLSVVSDPNFSPPTVPRVDLAALNDNGLIVNFATNESFLVGELVASALNENSEYTPFENSAIVRLVSTVRDLEGIYQERLANEFLQLLSSWIEGSNTHNISRFCQALALSVPTMDVLLLHISPKDLFGPLAKLIDDWQHDEDEINFQEVYTDFGCILLTLVLAYERFGLSLSTHLGCHEREGSFFQSLVGQRGINENLDELSPQRRDLLGGWISALFDAGGISDDLMRVSSVKDLYTLVPAIFRQAVVAFSAKIIDFEVLRGGLEYFLQPFLLPSLLLAFRWVGDGLWRQADVMTLVQIVQFLLMSDISPEAQRIHQIVLSITASELFQMLTHVAATASTTNGGSNGDQDQLFVEPRLLSILEQFYVAAPRDPLTELQSSVADALAHHVTALTQWASAPADAGPPGYHFGLVSRAVAELGATRVLLALLDCLDAAGGAGMAEGAAAGTPQFETTLEVVTALVTQSVSDNSANLNLRLDGNLVRTVVDCTEEEMRQLRVAATIGTKQESVAVPGATPGTAIATPAAAATPAPSLYGFKRLQANANAYTAGRGRP